MSIVLSATVLQAIIAFIVQWLLTPLILLGIFLLAAFLAFKDYVHDEVSVSSRFAFWAGCVFFIIVATATAFTGAVSDNTQSQGTTDLSIGSLVFYGVVGLVLALVIMVPIETLLESRAGAILIAILSASSLICIYTYFVAVSSRPSILGIALSVLFWSLIYGALRPQAFKKLFP